MLTKWVRSMGEYVPFFENEQVIGFINSGGDFTRIIHENESKTILWYNDEIGFKITDMVNGFNVEIDGDIIYLWNFLDLTPGVFGYIIDSVEEYVKEISKLVEKELNGRKTLLSYSGGKDSTAGLIVALKLQEFINFDLKVVYSHVPFLESPENIKFIEYVAKKLNIDIEILEADRETILEKLKKFGLPYRGFRWCTYQKVKPIRKIKKKLNIDCEIVSERAWESYKRMLALSQYAKQRKFIIGGQFKIVYPLTILDVVKISKEEGIIHNDYLKGYTRVSCDLCPYRNIFELKESINKVEDPGLIDSIIKFEHEQWYKKISSLEEFNKFALWRFNEPMARLAIKIRKKVIKEEREEIKCSKICSKYKEIWLKSNIKAPNLKIEDTLKLIAKAIETNNYGILNNNP